MFKYIIKVIIINSLVSVPLFMIILSRYLLFFFRVYTKKPKSILKLFYTLIIYKDIIKYINEYISELTSSRFYNFLNIQFIPRNKMNFNRNFFYN